MADPRRPSDQWVDNEVNTDATDKITLVGNVTIDSLAGNVTIDSISSEAFLHSYATIAGDDHVIKSSAGFLHAIVVGEPIASGEIEVGNSPVLGDYKVKVHLKGNASIFIGPKTYIVDTTFSGGITADLTNQTKTTFVYR